MAQVAHKFKEKSRTGDVLISENVDFNGLLLSDPVLRGLQNAGFSRPSPIQLKAIPLGRCGLDLIVQAKSGTGKTCVFSVIALESIATDTASTQVLVLAPTREIAVQIWEVINSIGSAVSGLECHTFIGGLPFHEDRMKLRRCHIAVGSPGRIKQLIESGALKTDSIRLFILDEADKLLEESFQEQINWIYSTLPDNKQMLALSATYPESLATHLTSYMRNPTYLRLNITDPALLGIRQYQQTVPYHPMAQVVFEHKSKALVNILSSVSFQQCLVFSNLQTRAQTLADSLASQGWPTACIAGCLDQKDRNEAMAKLKTYKCRVLISTDLTSRGIDADKVSMVINLDVPKDHETYLHRIGRAGRFGAFGIAITLTSEGQERLSLSAIEKKCNSHIHPLPDPLPSDLAKAEAPVFLGDVVSSEVINTDSNRQEKLAGALSVTRQPDAPTVAEVQNMTAEEPNRTVEEQDKTAYGEPDTVAREPDKIVGEPDKTAGQSGVEKVESAEATNTLDLPEKKKALNCPQEQVSEQETRANGINGHSLGNSLFPVGDTVPECSSREIEGDKTSTMNTSITSSMSGKQAEAEVKGSVENVSNKPKPKSNKKRKGKHDKTAPRDITSYASTGFDLHLAAAEHETLEDNAENQHCLPMFQAQNDPVGESVITEDQRSVDDNSFQQHMVNVEPESRPGFYLPQSPLSSWDLPNQATQLSFKCEKVNLPHIFKQSIGYKHLAKPYTYGEAHQSLKAFLQENDASRKTVDKNDYKIETTHAADQTEDAEKLSNIVDELQEVFDNNLRVSVENVDHRKHYVEDHSKNDVEENEMGSKREGSQHVLASKFGKKTEVSGVDGPKLAKSVGEDVTDVAKFVDKTKSDMSGKVGLVPNVTKDVSIKVGRKREDTYDKNEGLSITEKAISKTIADKCDEDLPFAFSDRNISNVPNSNTLPQAPNSHGRPRTAKAVGYRGKFSIGHLLEVERQKESADNEEIDLLTGHGNHNNTASKVAAVGDSKKTNMSVWSIDTAHPNKAVLQDKGNTIDDSGEGSSKRKTQPVEFQPAQSERKLDSWKESASESDQVVSEHSESDFTEDSDSDSMRSSDPDELKHGDETRRKQQKSYSHRQPMLLAGSDKRHQASKYHNGASGRNQQESWPGYPGPYSGRYSNDHKGHSRDFGHESETSYSNETDRNHDQYMNYGRQYERNDYAYHRTDAPYANEARRSHEQNRSYGHETDRSEFTGSHGYPGSQDWQQQYQYYPRPPAFTQPTDYWSPWSHYYGYPGYPQQPAYHQHYLASQPYYGGSTPPVHGRVDFEHALEATHKMQTEYIRTMSKLRQSSA